MSYIEFLRRIKKILHKSESGIPPKVYTIKGISTGDNHDLILNLYLGIAPGPRSLSQNMLHNPSLVDQSLSLIIFIMRNTNVTSFLSLVFKAQKHR
jgi:hypothetical protein